jgi:hypothetical protein
LDIGDGVGALIVPMPVDLVGDELFIRPAGASTSTTHTGIWERSINGRGVVVAVFPELPSGAYELVMPDGNLFEVDILSGQVTTVEAPPTR